MSRDDSGTDRSANDGMDPEDHYDESGVSEWERLEREPVSKLEHENTLDVLETHLPEGGQVLDAGGGPGRYSIWLAERGFEVEHVDLSAVQVRLAREKAREYGVADRIVCRKGDIRELPYGDDRFDAVCCLGGPLSHVVDADERAAAVAEFARVAGPGAVVFVSVMGRLAALREAIKAGVEQRWLLEALPELARTGDYTERLAERYDGEGWAECHWFRADEFERLLAEGGLDVVELVGLEGPASALQRELEGLSDDAMEPLRETVRTLRTDRSVVDASNHMLAVCRA